ncbi:methyltransferase domain-containing protein [Candidatus Dependentiae bacterium]|nr:methyltransferase domain-containing protein [Candidatus Dependentiae bacterium]
MQVFKDYAKYYDLLYKDKDYEKETEYINSLIKENLSDAKSILELGSGTGKHAILLCQKEYNLVGIDFSSKMVDIAKQRLLKEELKTNIEFFVADVRKAKLNKKFDVALSLFHVVSYMLTKNDLINMFKTVYNHLNTNGLFIFDCWYGPAVLSNKPEKRVKKLENDYLKLKRFANPVHHINDNIVDVEYNIFLQEKNSPNSFSFKEIHKMRYLFKPELKVLLELTGLKIIKSEEWLTGKSLNQNTWGACFICKKI